MRGVSLASWAAWVTQNRLRCTRAGTPDNSADIDYDHFPEEVTGRWAYCIHWTLSVCIEVLYQALSLSFCEMVESRTEIPGKDSNSMDV